MSEQIKFRYFSCVAGNAWRRPGTRQYIGAARTGKGFVFDESIVVAVPIDEINRNPRDWVKAKRLEVIRERTQKDFDACQKAQAEQSEREAAERKAKDAASDAEGPTGEAEGLTESTGGATDTANGDPDRSGSEREDTGPVSGGESARGGGKPGNRNAARRASRK